MIAFLNKHKPTCLLILVILIGAFLRFYKLDWGQGLFAHPDEYHIVASVAQLSFPDQMHPHFFSYGTVIIYLIYFTQEIIKSFSSTFNFAALGEPRLWWELLNLNSFLVGRFYSALFSTLTILIVYRISKSFMSTKFSLLAAFLVAITPGLIQQAHFTTPESALTFFLFGSLLFITIFIKHKKNFYLILSSIFLGLALGVKISSVVFLLPLLATIIIPSLKKPLVLIERMFLGLITVFTTFALAAPFVLIDYPAFRSNLDYEGSLAVGKLPVFYTRQFIETFPVLFQIEKIFPYTLGPSLLLLGIIGLAFLILLVIKKPKLEPILIIIAFLALFISNAFLFAKWTRFIAPTFPFFAIFAAYLLEKLTSKIRALSNFLMIFLLLSTMFWTTAFFSIYTNTDIRITASEWLVSYAKERSTFLVEGGNTIDIPLSGNFQRISLDFYPLEEDPQVREKIANALYTADYFLVQSRRMFMNHLRVSNLYPKTSYFYNALFDGKLGFEKIKEFHSYPSLGIGDFKLEILDESAEETWSVFDHPVIRVYQKKQQLHQREYSQILDGKNPFINFQ